MVFHELGEDLDPTTDQGKILVPVKESRPFDEILNVTDNPITFARKKILIVRADGRTSTGTTTLFAVPDGERLFITSCSISATAEAVVLKHTAKVVLSIDAIENVLLNMGIVGTGMGGNAVSFPIPVVVEGGINVNALVSVEAGSETGTFLTELSFVGYTEQIEK